MQRTEFRIDAEALSTTLDQLKAILAAEAALGVADGALFGYLEAAVESLRRARATHKGCVIEGLPAAYAQVLLNTVRRQGFTALRLSEDELAAAREAWECYATNLRDDRADLGVLYSLAASRLDPIASTTGTDIALDTLGIEILRAALATIASDSCAAVVSGAELGAASLEKRLTAMLG